MKKAILIVSFSLLGLTSRAQLNMTLRAVLYDSTVHLSNIGGYADSLGNEYALVGTSAGLSIVDVTNPSLPQLLFAVPGWTSSWREVKTWLHYAYVTNESGDGLQIINLQYLPDSVQVRQWHGDGAITGLSTSHALHIDSGYLYLYGSNVFSGAVICDILTDPWNPHYLGQTTSFPFWQDTYVHDGFVSHDTLWAGHIYTGVVNVWDCTNKAAPVLLATQSTPGTFTHNTWLSDDHSVLFTTDEIPNSFVTAYDITDLSNIRRLSMFQTAPTSTAIVHNTHILNDYAVTSWYTEGIVVTDVSRPANPIEVGKYDTNSDTGSAIAGCWGVYPFLPSGTLVASDIYNGLFVFTPNYVRGCYLEGTVTDSVTGLPLQSVRVDIDTTGAGTSSTISGIYRTGLAAAGTYNVSFTKAGYVSKTFTVSLSNGVLTSLDLELAPIGAGLASLHTSDFLTAWPNPSRSGFRMRYNFDALPASCELVIHDASGRQVYAVVLSDRQGELIAGENLAPGIYFASLRSGGTASLPLKLVCSE